MANNAKKIAFTGGGTAGHVYPALAVSETLAKMDSSLEFMWIGQQGGIEQKLLAETKIPFYGISAGKFRRYFSLQNFTDLFKIAKGYFDALRVLKETKPDILFSKGGFVTLPPIWAAASLKIPIFIHESDSDMGLANRLASPFATKIFVPYESSAKAMQAKYKDKIVVSGNPVRDIIKEADRNRGRALYDLTNDKLFILVLGGSLGAKQVNDLVAEIVPNLPVNVFVLHQMGNDLYKESKLPNYKTVAYIGNEIADLIAGSDIIISRAGAGSIWEFATIGSVPIFIPLGMRGDQYRNAMVFKKQGACEVLAGKNATGENLFKIIEKLLQSNEIRTKMKEAILTLANKDAKQILATNIIEEVK